MKIEFRRYRNEDLDEIKKFLGTDCWPLRHLLITERTVLRGDEIIAYGNVRLIPEETIILDHEKLSKKEKLFVLKELLKIAHRDTKMLNTFMHLYGFCQDEEFAVIMERHFGYEMSDRKIITLPLLD